MTLDILPWQTSQWQNLQRRKDDCKLPHALLLTGIPGVGKLDFAEQFAHSLLCSDSQNACGNCKSCKLLQAGNHPDLLTIFSEDGKAIKVDVIRDVVKFVNYSAHIGKYKIIIIDSADKMNINAANALLKTLEEPSNNVLLILVTNRLMALPATVRSRCQIIPFAAPDEKVALQWLRTQEVNIDSASLLLKFANGAPLKVINFVEQDLLTFRNKIFQQFNELLIGKLTLASVSQEWQKLDLQQILFHLTSWVVDLIRLHSMQDVKLINFDFAVQLKKLTKKYDIKKLYKFYDDLISAQNLLHGPCNLNPQLMLEGLLINLII